jgi:leader peptidase (prepilin peptidase)/N-methyltransferase
MNLTTIIVFVAGLLLGTLLNTIIVRLPREQAFGGWPRCIRCGARLAPWQLIPVAGWLLQGGRARCCGRRLHPIFPLVELGYAAVLTIFYLRYGLSAPFFYLAFVAAVLVVTGVVDWLHRWIYTLFILGPALIVLLATLAIPQFSFLNALLGAVVGGVVFILLFVLARALFPGRETPFGMGDVYLAIFIGAAVGLTNLMPALFYGVLLAGVFSAVLLVLRRAGRPNIPEYISYGAFLCLGALGYLSLTALRG